MTETQGAAGEQLGLLVGGLILLAGLLTIATVAATQLWLSLSMGAALLVVALLGLWHGIPRVLILITVGFGVVLLSSALFQLPVQESSAAADPDVVPTPRPVLISGVVSESGRPLAGVPVQVRLWPSLDEAEVGERIDVKELRPVSTDAQGRYVVTLPVEDVPAKYLMSGRTMNFAVMLIDPLIAEISTSARYPRDSEWWVDAFAGRDTGPKTLDFDLGAMRATETDGDGDVQKWPILRLDGD